MPISKDLLMRKQRASHLLRRLSLFGPLRFLPLQLPPLPPLCHGRVLIAIVQYRKFPLSAARPLKAQRWARGGDSNSDRFSKGESLLFWPGEGSGGSLQPHPRHTVGTKPPRGRGAASDAQGRCMDSER